MIYGIEDAIANGVEGPEERPCMDCMSARELCCGYGICELELDEWAEQRARTSPYEVVRWTSDNLRDLRDETCPRWRG